MFYTLDKWISLCWDPVHTGRPAALVSPAAGENVAGSAQGPHLPCLSQVRVGANAAKPSAFHTHCSETALHNTYRLNLLLIRDRTDIFLNVDGQLECQNAGNNEPQCSTSASPVPAGKQNTNGLFEPTWNLG